MIINGIVTVTVYFVASSASINWLVSFLEKQREFYKNAKYISKFNKSVKKEGQQIELKVGDGSENTSGANKRSKSRDNKAKYSLGEIYKKKSEELEKERREREAVIKAKNEERQAKEARRKADKVKMFKKTRHGQPVMKYRIERLLESIQGSQRSR